MPDEVNNKRAAILARCSSEANVCDQILLLKQYAADKYIVNDDDIYGDNISGSSAISERVELKRLMQNVEEGKTEYAVVLVQDAARLGKSAEQVQEVVDWFTSRNIPLHFQQDKQIKAGKV
jgi:DNA invertase Pin-like site-specific DNA recombinase